MASPIPNSHSQFFDNRGNPIGNGTVSYFYPGTTTPKPTWKDPTFTNPNPHPVVTDSNGRAQVFGTGRYRQQLRLANGTLLFDGETSLGEVDLPLAVEIASQRFDDETTAFSTSGFAVPGRGAARYVRLANAPSIDELDVGLNRWLFQSNGDTVWWRLAESNLTDLMFGVIADATISTSNGQMVVAGTDDTAALQAAVNFIVYYNQGSSRALFLPTGLRRITNTVHLGYGDAYVDWIIEGDAPRGFDANTGFHSGIVAEFNDRPALNIQGARSASLSRISVIGLNHSWLYNNAESITDRAPKSAWRGPQVRPTSVDTRYAPYCGIAVDGYSGVRQASSSYPDAIYPIWFTGYPQYERGASSGVKFTEVACSGFEVGIVVQPNLMPTASNGDFIRWDDCDLNFNEVGLSISHSDARVISLHRCRMHFCHTAIDGLTYGSGTCNFAANIADCSFDHAYRILNVDIGNIAQNLAPSVIITNAYAEALYSIGSVREPNGLGRPGTVRFIGGEFGFHLRPAEFSPAWYLSGNGEVVARFEEVSLSGTYGVFPVNCILAEFSANLPRVAQLVFEQITASGRRASSALCGFDAPSVEKAAVRPFSIYANDGTAIFGRRYLSHGWDFTGSGATVNGMPVPLMARSVDFNGHHVSIAAAPVQVLDRAATPLVDLIQSGTEWTFSCAGSFLTDPANPQCGLGRGDVVRDEATGHLYYVKSASFTGSGATLQVTMTLRQLTGVYSSDGTSWQAAATLAPASGILRFRCGRRVLAGARRRLAMNAAATSSTVSLVAIGPETFATNDLGTTVWTLAAGDYMVPADTGAATLEDSVFAKAKIVSLPTSGGLPTGQIVLDSNARRSGLFPTPLFIKGN